MKIVLFLIFCITASSTVPKPHLTFRNLYKNAPKTVDQKVSPKIIGGQEATPHSLPYQVFLEFFSSTSVWNCGGALISENYVLTAAHCVQGSKEVEVILGAHNISDSESTQVYAFSSEYIPHEYYSSEEFVNDIALIEISVNLTDEIQPIALPTRDNDYVGVIATLSGWGLTDPSETYLSDVLNFAQVEVISNEDCQTYYGNLNSSILCTSGVEGAGFCSGDSGGPLMVHNTLIGIVSFGVPKCVDGFPAAYSNIGTYLDWIENNTGVKRLQE